jgi:hypothetical protein
MGRDQCKVYAQSKQHDQRACEPDVGVERLPKRLADTEGHAGHQILEQRQIEKDSVLEAVCTVIATVGIDNSRVIVVHPLNAQVDNELWNKLDEHRAKDGE